MDAPSWVDYGTQSSEALRVPRGEAILLEIRSPAYLDARVEGATRSLPVRSGTTVFRLRAQADGALVFGDSVHVTVVVEPRSEHDRWLNQPPSAHDLLCVARSLMAHKGCVACHGTPTLPLVGGSLCGLLGQERVFEGGERLLLSEDTIEDYLRESIRDPGARVVEGRRPVMPRITLTEDELASLMRYLVELDGECQGDDADCPWIVTPLRAPR
ncbi:MAG: hypothetical protein U0353_16625 [Sandaracinus sp.]